MQQGGLEGSVTMKMVMVDSLWTTTTTTVQDATPHHLEAVITDNFLY